MELVLAQGAWFQHDRSLHRQVCGPRASGYGLVDGIFLCAGAANRPRCLKHCAAVGSYEMFALFTDCVNYQKSCTPRPCKLRLQMLLSFQTLREIIQETYKINQPKSRNLCQTCAQKGCRTKGFCVPWYPKRREVAQTRFPRTPFKIICYERCVRIQWRFVSL